MSTLTSQWSKNSADPSFHYRLVLEGPDEPDPAFEEFYPGTKRYTPRSRKFGLRYAVEQHLC